MRIVCVDDDPIFLAIVTEYLRALDMEVVATLVTRSRRCARPKQGGLRPICSCLTLKCRE